MASLSSDYLQLDNNDELSIYRSGFLFPSIVSECSSSSNSSSDDSHCIYLCGNSLGLQPKGLRDRVLSHLDKWDKQGVEGHFNEPDQWLSIDDTVSASMGSLIGAFPHETVLMNSLTCNLHLMMMSFYRPTSTRNKILIEGKAFPSDAHAVISQIVHHGYNPIESLIELHPRDNETCLRDEDIVDYINTYGDTIALILFSGVQYYTGQLFDIQGITAIGKSKGCIVGFDLAHAVGNVPLKLHEWNVDFACWCTYKYMNCGPGAIGGCFVHETHTKDEIILSPTTTSSSSSSNSSIVAEKASHLTGWWGHRQSDRFEMSSTYVSSVGVNRYRLSNPPVLLIACVRASLDVFDAVGMDRIRRKSIQLTRYLEELIVTDGTLSGMIHILTPSSHTQRGCQLSLSINDGYTLDAIFAHLQQHHVIVDVRKPNVIRVAPCPLYNSYRDVYRFAQILKKYADGATVTDAVADDGTVAAGASGGQQ